MTVGCLIAAGENPTKVSEVAVRAGEVYKALIPLRGKRLVEYVFLAVQRTGRITQTVVTGAPQIGEIAKSYGMPWLPGQRGMLESFIEGSSYLFNTYRTIDRVLVAMADIPMLTAEHLNWYINTCATTDHDFYGAIIRKETMEGRFPDSERTYTKTRDGAFCGGDLLMFRRESLRSAKTESTHWSSAIKHRKTVWPMLFRISLRYWAKILTRRITIAEVEQAITQMLGIRVRAVISPYAEHGMDVDKPFQLEIVERELESLAQ